MRRCIHIFAIMALLISIVSINRAANAGVYGPNWAAEPFVASIALPDLFMKDSNMPAPTNAFNWIDADAFNGGASTGIDSAQPQVANQIWTSSKVPFGFDFPYFGQLYNGVYVSLHGWCSFANPGNPRQSATARPNNVPIDQAPFDDFIAVYWDQLYQTTSNGQVFKKPLTLPMLGLVIQWADVQLIQGNLNTSALFQVIFWENGDINFNYTSYTPGAIYANGASATIGLKGGATQFLSYGFNQLVLPFDGFGILFTRTEPDRPPKVGIGPANPTTLEEFPYTNTAKAVLQFYIEPWNVEGTVDAVGVIVQGPKVGMPAPYFGIYIVRDVNGNGFRDPEDAVVSGVDPGSGLPLLWDPWAGGTYSTYLLMFDAQSTADGDNLVKFNEGVNGKKYYLVMSIWGNLSSQDDYRIGIRDLLLSGTKFSGLSPSLYNVLGTTLRVAQLTAPEVTGPYTYPPLPFQEIDVRAENVVALSYSVTASPDFGIQMLALGMIKSGSGQGIYVACRVYADYGEHGVYEPGVDVDVTADGWMSQTTSSTGTTLSEGNPSGVFYVFLTAPADLNNPGNHPNYLPKDGGTKYYMVVLTFFQSTANEGDTYRVSLSEIIYTGGPGSPIKLADPLAGSILQLKAPDLPLGVINTPYSAVVSNLSAVPGGSDLVVGRFSFRPYNRSGLLHYFTLNASGTGDDLLDIKRLRIVMDKNMNGVLETSDKIYYDGRWPSDNGSIRIDLVPTEAMFSAWRGGTTQDYTEMINFFLVYDFETTVQYGSTFTYTVSEISFTYESMPEQTIPTNWEAPLVTIQNIETVNVAVTASPYMAVRERFLIPTTGNTVSLQMAVVKVTAGSRPIRVSSFSLKTSSGGFTGDGDESRAIDSVYMFPDLNLNFDWDPTKSFPETALGETVSWIGNANARPFVANDGSVTIFVLDPNFGDLAPYYMTAYQSVTWRIFFTFNENVKPGDGFMAHVTSMQYESVDAGQYVSQPPIMVNIEGGRKEAISSVYDGGSITITKAPGLASGAVRYVIQGNFVEANLFRLYAGNVETILINSIVFHFIGTGSFDTPATANSDLQHIGFARDNGDGVLDYAYDADFAGSLSVSAANRTGTFTPQGGANPMRLQPSQSYYVMIYFVLANPNPAMAIGKTFSCYVGPDDLNVTGGNSPGGVGFTPRTVGDPVARFGSNVYGWKAIVGTSSQTGGGVATGDMTPGNTTPDNGNPWTNVNPDWSNSTAGGGGCFVATASFASYSVVAVRSLCDIRDSSLSAASTGSSLTSLYYAASPAVAQTLAESNTLRALVRTMLDSAK